MKKGKGKAAAGQEKELLVNAELRLKSGIHYALLGRNGSGKSSMYSERYTEHDQPLDAIEIQNSFTMQQEWSV